MALPVTCLIRGWERFSVKDGVLTVLLVLTGIGMVLRSLDREKSQEDRREERDERNRWIELRSQAVCYRVLWWLVVAGLLACGVGYGVTKEDVYLGQNRQGRATFAFLCRFSDSGELSVGMAFFIGEIALQD